MYNVSMLRSFDTFPHHPQEVLSPDAADVGFAIPFAEELAGEVDEL